MNDDDLEEERAWLQLRLDLLHACGYAGLPHQWPMAGWQYGVPTIEPTEAMTIRLALQTAALQRAHDEVLVWEVMHAIS